MNNTDQATMRDKGGCVARQVRVKRSPGQAQGDQKCQYRERSNRTSCQKGQWLTVRGKVLCPGREAQAVDSGSGPALGTLLGGMLGEHLPFSLFGSKCLLWLVPPKEKVPAVIVGEMRCCWPLWCGLLDTKRFHMQNKD